MTTYVFNVTLDEREIILLQSALNMLIRDCIEKHGCNQDTFRAGEVRELKSKLTSNPTQTSSYSPGGD